ncbi:MAG TPA: TonB-dependent receptor [Terriglobales bacterium]|nr:TonB-dependent receptor [Terriglobales bacterium]
MSLEQLGSIEVTSVTKEPEEVWKTPAAIYVITQDDIRRSGATSIADALRLAPGVEVGRISSTTWAVGIRGLQSNFSKSVLVLIDGRSVYTPLFAGVYWDVQDVVLEDIDRIEVIRGPGGTIWGPNAVNGVINIITKKASETHGMLATATAGNVDHFIGEAQYGGGNGGGFDYRVFAKGFQRGAEYHTDRDNFDNWHQERGGFRADWQPNSTDSVLFESDVYGGDSPHRIGTVDADDAVSGGDFLTRWRRDLGNGSDIYFQGYFDRTIRIGPQLGEVRNTIDLDFLHRIHSGDRNEFTWGAGLRWTPEHFVQKQVSVDLEPHDLLEHIYSGFAQDEFAIVPQRVSLTVGAKLEHATFSGFDVQPSARLLWTPSQHQSFWAAVTRAVTTPSRIEEDFQLLGALSANPLVLIRVSGNPNFNSEKLIGYEGGYRRLLSKALYVDLDVFHNHYTDLQSFGAIQPIAGTFEGQPALFLTIPYTNAISGATDGFEIAPNWYVASWWRLAGSYSFVTPDFHANAPTSDISSTGSVSTYEGSTPRHEAEITSQFNLPKHFEFDQFFRYASALPAQKVDAYETVDLRLGWRPAEHFEISVVGQNLLQPFHLEWGTGDPSQPPIGIRRAGYVKLTWMP